MKDKHIHEFRYVGSGTNLIKKLSDVQYNCDCGKTLILFLSLEKYFEHNYPKTMMLEIHDKKHISKGGK